MTYSANEKQMKTNCGHSTTVVNTCGSFFSLWDKSLAVKNQSAHDETGVGQDNSLCHCALSASHISESEHCVILSSHQT